MFIANYQTMIQPLTTKKDLPHVDTKTTKQKLFTATAATKPTTTTQPTTAQYTDYIVSKNYFANRYKLTQEQNQPKEYKKFQTLSKQAALPDAYAAPFTSLYELSKPKKALNTTLAQPETLYQHEYKKQQQNLMLNTYKANSIYYQRTSA